MNTTDLPSPGLVTGSHALRKETAKVISQAEIGSRLSPGATTKQVKDLIVFFKASLAAVKRLEVRDNKRNQRRTQNESK